MGISMRDHILNILKTSKNRDEGGWLSSYQVSKDANVSGSTVMARCGVMASEQSVERKEETVKHVRRVMWRVK